MLDKSKYEIMVRKYHTQCTKWVQETLFPEFTCDLRIDWSPNRQCSRGGMYLKGPGINIAMYPATSSLRFGKIHRFKEYASYDADKEIGGFYFTDSEHKIAALVAHEVAHAVQYYYYSKSGVIDRPHGDVFKNYYRMLRTRFVNSMLPEQQPLQEQYEKWYNEVVANSTIAVTRLANILDVSN